MPVFRLVLSEKFLTLSSCNFDDTMKFLKTVAAMLLICIGLLSCTKESGEHSITFQENPVKASYTGGDFSLLLVSRSEWKAAPVDAWITNVNLAGNKLTFKVQANTGKDSRTGTIRFTVVGGKDTKDLKVIQGGTADALKAEKSSVTVNAIGDEITLTVSSAEEWGVASVSESWITAVKKNDSTLSISAQTNFTGAKRSGKVILQTVSKSQTFEINIEQQVDDSIFGGAKTEMGRKLVYGTNGLVKSITSEKSYDLDDRVSVLEMQFKSAASAPYSLFVFEVDLTGDVTMLASCYGDDPASIKATDAEKTKIATVREQFYSMKTKRTSIDLLGGTNGDFCFLASSSNGRNNLLHGVMYKDGVCLKGTFDAGVSNVFAIMKDGSARIMSQSDYAKMKSDIQEAIGGKARLLTNGSKPSFSDDTYDPRTAVAVTSDYNKVILLVMDGRSSGYSDGANYAMLADIFLAFGGHDAINLDGGGSSTFLIKNSSASKGFETRNKPSSGSDRSIVNGLAIVKKK